jgi:hypothetical protein
MVELNRETHTYTPNLPSVTGILKAAGIIDATFFTEEGRERGSAVHLACEYFDQGDLDEDSLDEQIAGYVDAYKTFKSASGWEFDWIEFPVMDKTGMYAGTPDRALVSRPRKLVDIKTGAHQKWHGPQTAAYVNCLDDPFSYSRYGLYLQGNGKFTLREYPKAEFISDLAIFQSALNIYYWKECR